LRGAAGDAASDGVGVTAGDTDKEQRRQLLLAYIGKLGTVVETAAEAVREERVNFELKPELADGEERVREGRHATHVRDEFVVEPSVSVASNYGHVADFGGDVFGAGGCTERVSARAAVDEPVWVGRDVPSAPRVDGAADDAATGRFFAGRLDCGFQAFWRWRRRVCDESGEQAGRWRRIWRRREWIRVAR
jgi:hypothetical protein